MKQEIKNLIKKIISEEVDFSVEIPTNKDFGDYSTNVAMVLKKTPTEIAEKIKSNLFKKIEVKNGFINFFVSDKYFIENLKNIDKDFGKNDNLKNKKVILDYTDPNPFKEFHIGHLMSNAIGESLSRIFEFQGANVKRVCYQGDVGLHIAKAIWFIINQEKILHNDYPDTNILFDWQDLVAGKAYAFGNRAYENNEIYKKEIIEINKKIYDRNDKNINKLYDQGKKESLKYFDKIYKKLDTKFDDFIFESEVSDLGKKTVEKGLKSKVFEKGENGAIIFKGEKFNLHTRVFINSEGIPTYEAKDLGLAQIKYKKYPYDLSFVVTGNEINEYFKVMKRAMQEVLPDLANKTNHIGHGMLRLPEGKMSSRTGKVITGESLINKIQEMVQEKIKDRDLSSKEKNEIAEKVAISAIKYSVLKQSAGSDIIYDFDKSVSFNGDSGPYLQYSYTRAISVLEKAKKAKIKASLKVVPENVGQLEKLMTQFPEIVIKSALEYQPHYIATYLTQLASAFNNFYTQEKIVDKDEKFSPYKIAVTQAFANIIQNGLWLLGIQTLNKM